MLFLILSLAGVVFAIWWAAHPKSAKEQGRAFFVLAGMIFLTLLSANSVCSDYGLLWYGQEAENAVIDLDIDENAVEETSFLYLLQELGPDAGADDVRALLGDDCEESEPGGRLSLLYSGTSYTLDGVPGDILRFGFDRGGRKLMSVTWGRSQRNDGFYEDLVAHVTAHALGQPESTESDTVRWRGVSIENNDYFVLLSRHF